MFVSDGRGDAVRLERLARAAIDGGVRCIHLREPALGDAELRAVAERLRLRLDACDGLLVVNERADLVSAGVAHALHQKASGPPVDVARRALLAGAFVAKSVHDEVEVAAAGDADWLVLAPILPTASKPWATALGLDRARALTAAARAPTVWLGGLSAAALRSLSRGAMPVGFAALGAFAIDDDAATVRAAAFVAAVDAILGPP